MLSCCFVACVCLALPSLFALCVFVLSVLLSCGFLCFCSCWSMVLEERYFISLYTAYMAEVTLTNSTWLCCGSPLLTRWTTQALLLQQCSIQLSAHCQNPFNFSSIKHVDHMIWLFAQCYFLNLWRVLLFRFIGLYNVTNVKCCDD